MKTKQAFTLIELLVVVLIIGVLAAVALPQYQKTVEKSRATEAMQLLKSIDQAVDTYHLASGEYPKKFDELSIDIPWTGQEKGYQGGVISDVRSNGKWSIQLEGDNANYYSIIATRLDGKYEGGGFLIEKSGPGYFTTWEYHKLYCAEYLAGNKIFSGTAGDFCKKVMGATLKGSSSALRAYTLPF